MRKLLIVAALTGPWGLLLATGALCSPVLPVSAGSREYPAITGTAGFAPSAPGAVSGVTTGTLPGTTCTTSVFPVAPGVLADTLRSVWSDSGITGGTFSAGRASAVGPSIRRLNEIKLDSGFMDLYTYSAALLYEYGRSHSEKLLRYAVDLSPSMPEPYFVMSYRMFGSGIARYSDAVAYLVKGITSFFDDPYNILRFVSNRLINLTITVLIVFLIFAALLIVRYSREVHAVLRNALPEYVPGYTIDLFSLLAIAVPLLFGMGPVWLLLFWLMATAVFQKWPERVFSMMVIVIIALLANIALIAVATIREPAEQPFTGIMAMNYGDLSGGLIDGLISYADTHASDFYSNLYTGIYYKRTGAYGRASVYYKRLEDNGYGDIPAVMCDAGNLDFAMGNTAAAEQSYRKAVSLDSGSFSAHYDLGQLYLMQVNFEGTSELDKAKEADPNAFAYYATIYDKSNINRIFADALPGPKALAYTMFRNTLSDREAAEVSGIILGKIIAWPGAGHLPYLALCFAVVFLIATAFSARLRSHRRCTSCGRIYSTGRRDDGYVRLLCTDCLRFHIKNEVKDTIKKVEITRRIRRWKVGLKVLNTVVSALVPGGGQILRGETVKGVLTLSMFVYLVTEYVSSFGLIASVFPPDNPFVPMLRSATLAGAAALYLINIIAAARSNAEWY